MLVAGRQNRAADSDDFERIHGRDSGAVLLGRTSTSFARGRCPQRRTSVCTSRQPWPEQSVFLPSCGNVETRVLCGFPSSEGGQNRCGRRSIIPPFGAPFPQRGSGLSAILARFCCWAADGAEIGAFQKAA